MSKPMEIYFAVMQMVLFCFQGYYLQYFYGSFLECRMRSGYGGFCVLAVYAALRSGMYFVWPSEYDSMAILGKQAASLGILAVLVFCFYRAFHAITFFLVAAYQAVLGISVYMTVILTDWPSDRLFALLHWCMRMGMITSIRTFEVLSAVSVAGMHFLQIVIVILLIHLSVRRIVLDYREKDIDMPRTELLFVLIPALLALLLCTLLRMIMVSIEENRQEFLYHKYPALVMILPVILLLALAGILYGVRSFQDIIQLNKEKNGRIILEKQISSMQEHIGEVERIYCGIRSLRHDMKNTLAIVARLALENGGQRQEELQGYLRELNQTIDDMEMQFRTGNAVVDALLNMKYHEIIRLAPDLKFSAEQLAFPKDMAIQSYDIGIILGNALDNALEACVKLKKKEPEANAFIRIASFGKGNLLFLKIENSFDGNIIQKPQMEFPATDKADKDMHGIGMPSIKSAAEKYQGTVDFKTEDGTFILAVMLKNERRDV